MTVVFDSGIWISAMHFGGMPLEAVVEAVARDRFAVCAQIEEEIVRVLTRKFGWEAERVDAELAFYWLNSLRRVSRRRHWCLPRPQRRADSRMRGTK